jgi:hypothetical protein
MRIGGTRTQRFLRKLSFYLSSASGWGIEPSLTLGRLNSGHLTKPLVNLKDLWFNFIEILFLI